MKKLFLLIGLSQILSCGIVEDDNIKEKETAPQEFTTSSLNYYMNLQTMMRDNAIGPNYMSHLDTTNNFSVGFICDVKQLYTKETSKIKVRVKYYFPRPGKASVVCSISKADSVIYWRALDLDNSVAINKWATNEFNFDFPKTYKEDEVLAVYVWAPNREEVYVEDIYVKAKK